MWRVYGLTSGAWDLGFAVSALAAINRGGIGTPAPWAGHDFFAHHFSPLLVPLAPIADTRWGAYALVLLQVAAFVISVLVASRLIRESIEARDRVLVLVAYATAPAILFAVFFDFHANVLALPLVMLTLYGLSTKRDGLAIASSLVMVLAREDVAILALLIAIAEVRRNRRYTMVVAPAAMLALAGWALVTLEGMRSTGVTSLYSYIEMGDPTGSLTRMVGVVWAGGLLVFLLVTVLVPWLVARPLASRYLVVLLISSLLYLLADFPLTKTITVHYYVMAPPLLLTAVCQGRGRIFGRRRRLWVVGTMLGLVGGPLVTGLYGPESQEVVFRTIGEIHANQQAIRATHLAIGCLPTESSLATTSAVTPLVPHFQAVQLLPYPFEPFSQLEEEGVALVPIGVPAEHPDYLVTDNAPLAARALYTRSDLNEVLWSKAPQVPAGVDQCLERGLSRP